MSIQSGRIEKQPHKWVAPSFILEWLSLLASLNGMSMDFKKSERSKVRNIIFKWKNNFLKKLHLYFQLKVTFMSSLFIIIHKFFCDIFCPIIVFTLFILNASCFVVGFGIQKHIQFFFHFVLQYLFSSFINAVVYVEIDWGQKSNMLR